MSKKKRPANHGDKESRRRKASERLGTAAPRCLLCDETNPICLELHHTSGREHDDETVILCSNHHDNATDLQKDHPIIGGDCGDELAQISHRLMGLGDLVILAMEQLKGADPELLLDYVADKLQESAMQLLELNKPENFK